MVIEEVGESLFPDEELGVRAVDPATGLGESEGDLREATETRVFGRMVQHTKRTEAHLGTSR
jgi:hypothetical protein